MIRNGKVYCDRPQCSLEVTRYHRSIRVLKPAGDSENPTDYMHFHNREGYTGDCWIKTLEAAEAVKNAKPPTQLQFDEFSKWQAQQDAKRNIAGRG